MFRLTLILSITIAAAIFLNPLPLHARDRNFSEIAAENNYNSAFIAQLEKSSLDVKIKNEWLSTLKNKDDQKYYQTRLNRWKRPSDLELVTYLDEFHILVRGKITIRLSRDAKTRGVWINDRLFSWNTKQSLRTELQLFSKTERKQESKKANSSFLLFSSQFANAAEEQITADASSEAAQDIVSFYVMDDRILTSQEYATDYNIQMRLKRLLGPRPGGAKAYMNEKFEWTAEYFQRQVTCNGKEAHGQIYIPGSSELSTFRTNADGSVTISYGKNPKQYFRLSPDAFVPSGAVNTSNDINQEIAILESRLGALLDDKARPESVALGDLATLYQSLGAIACNLPGDSLPFYTKANQEDKTSCLPPMVVPPREKQANTDAKSISNCKAGWFGATQKPHIKPPRGKNLIDNTMMFLWGVEPRTPYESPLEKFFAHCFAYKNKSVKDIATELQTNLNVVKSKLSQLRFFNGGEGQTFQVERCSTLNCSTADGVQRLEPSDFIKALAIKSADGRDATLVTRNTIAALSSLHQCCGDKTCKDTLSQSGIIDATPAASGGATDAPRN